MKILLISRLFAPKNVIGAVRPTQLAINLAKNGHEITCITELTEGQLVDDKALSPIVVHRVKTGTIGKANIRRESSPNISQSIAKNNTVLAVSKKEKRNRAAKFIRNCLYVQVHSIDEYEWAKAACKKVEELLRTNHYDIVFSSFGPSATVLAGLRIKSMHPDIVWVSDMRDPMTNDSQGYLRRKIYSYRERQMIKKADAITTISEALGKKYKEAQSAVRKRDTAVYVVENGYDDSAITPLQSDDDGILRFGYTGTMYGGMRRMDSLFRAIKELESEKGKKLAVEIHYAGAEEQEIIDQAKRYDAVDYLSCHGSLSRKDAILLQQKCDVLCVLSWNTKNEQGVLTGKFPEYLKLRKPVLAIITGDVEDAELTERIKKLNIGYSYECIKDDQFEDFKEWIKTCINRKENGQQIIDAINDDELEEYSYSRLALKMERIFQLCIQQ